jgi:hypothetical protein
VGAIVSIRRFVANALVVLVSLTVIVIGALVAEVGWDETLLFVRVPVDGAYRLIVPSPLVRRTRALEWSNCRWDVSRAVRRHDFRLIGIGGIGLFFPGLEGKEAEVDLLTKRYGYRFIAGTSDYSESEEQSRFQHAAYEYAKAYNQLLFPRIPR